MIRLRDDPAGWGLVARLLHWIMAALILFQLGLGCWMTRFEADVLARFSLTQTHKSWGFVILVLALLRILWRLSGPVHPALPATLPAWQRRAAALSHAALYSLILAMPVLGWILASASPAQDVLHIRNRVLGAFALPDPWNPGSERIADLAGALHSTGAALLATLVLVHVAAALHHHFIGRDAVLSRMIRGK